MNKAGAPVSTLLDSFICGYCGRRLSEHAANNTIQLDEWQGMSRGDLPERERAKREWQEVLARLQEAQKQVDCCRAHAIQPTE
jgi:hypothetical protein